MNAFQEAREDAMEQLRDLGQFAKFLIMAIAVAAIALGALYVFRQVVSAFS